ncbi:CinA family protein [Succinivibrio sp.]|uniref:CinA family protein n=1 Tax=Succinivibrio sp. TaxID=2053619 RepID=UPI003866F217
MKESLLKEISNTVREFKSLSAEYGEIYVTAESLTAGFIGASIVEIPGSSGWFDRGFITYSNESKMELLEVKEDTLKSVGAVSEETAVQMVEGALKHSSLATIGVSVTGIAGPDGGSEQKPVGTVWMGLMKKGQKAYAHCFHFKGDREEIRLQTTLMALKGLKALTMNKDPESILNAQ